MITPFMNWQRKALTSVVAMSNVDVFVIANMDVITLFRTYPEFQTILFEWLMQACLLYTSSADRTQRGRADDQISRWARQVQILSPQAKKGYKKKILYLRVSTCLLYTSRCV